MSVPASWLTIAVVFAALLGIAWALSTAMDAIAHLIAVRREAEKRAAEMRKHVSHQ